MTPKDITPGESYACRFRVTTFTNDQGEVVDTRHLQPGETVPNGKPNTYQGFGVIQTRDTQRELLEIWDNTNTRTWVVSYRDVWDIDTVEWITTEEDHPTNE